MGAPRQQQLTLQLPNIAATSDDDAYLDFHLEGEWYIKTLSFIPSVTSTAHASNGATISLTNVTKSATLHSHDTLTGGNGTLTEGTPVDATLTEGLNRMISNGDTLRVRKAESGTGVIAGGSYCMLLEHRPL